MLPSGNQAWDGDRWRNPAPPGPDQPPPERLREDFALCSPPALGSPGRGGRRARPLGAHVESTAPRCRRGTQTPRTPRGCQRSPSGRMDPLGPAGQRGTWRGVGTEVSGGASPLWPGRETGVLEGRKVSLQARRRRMLTGVGLNAESVAPPISRRRELSFSTRDRPCPGCPTIPQGTPGCPRMPQGARLLSRARERLRCPQAPPRVPQSRESKSGPCPGPESHGGSRVWGVGMGMACRQNADAPLDPVPKVRGQWEPRSAGTHGAARQPFRVSRYKGAVAIRPRMFSVYWGGAGGKDGVTCGGNEESPVSPPSLSLLLPGVPRAGGVRAAALHRGLSGERSRQAAIPAPTPESGRKSLSFQQRLMHQTSIFRTIELVIFFLLN